MNQLASDVRSAEVKIHFRINEYCIINSKIPDIIKEKILYNIKTSGEKFLSGTEDFDKFLIDAIGPEDAQRHSEVIKQATRVDFLNISLPFSYIPLILDFPLRWIMFILLRNNYSSVMTFVVSNMILSMLIAISYLTASSFEEKSIKLKLQKAKNNIAVTFDVKDSGLGLFFVFLGWLSMCYVAFNFLSGVWGTSFWALAGKYAIAAASILIYAIYVAMIYQTSYKYSYTNIGRSRQEIEARVDSKSAPEIKPTEAASGVNPTEKEIDNNDVEITDLDVQIFTMSRRVDAYTLESTLFGALSFSAFLTIVTSDYEIIGHIKILFDYFGHILFGPVPPGLTLAGIGTAKILQALIAVETLFCSLFFILVIVSRLRFMDLLQDIEHLIKLSQVFNLKEEKIFHLLLERKAWKDKEVDTTDLSALENRLGHLNRQVVEQIRDSKHLLVEFASIVGWMKFCRFLGINSFVIILITSAAFVSGALAFIFTAFTIIAHSYTSVEDFFKKRRMEKLLRDLTSRGGAVHVGRSKLAALAKRSPNKRSGEKK